MKGGHAHPTAGTTTESAHSVAAAVGEWWAYDYPPIELRLDRRRERVGYLAACNVPYYGGAVRMAPGADLDDGLLDLVLFRGRGRLATLGFGRDLVLGEAGLDGGQRVDVGGTPFLLKLLEAFFAQCPRHHRRRTLDPH